MGRRSFASTVVALGVTAALTVLVGTAAARAPAGGIAGSDPADDFLVACEASSAPRVGVAAMDLTRGRALGERDGYEVFELETAGDASAYFSSEPPSASFVITVVPAPGGSRYELIREIHAGRRRSVVERDGAAVPGAELLVDAIAVGAARLSVRGIEGLGTESRWAATANVLPDVAGPRLCDRLGFDAAGNPALRLRPIPAGTAPRPPDARPADEDDGSWVWWFVSVFGVFAVLALAWWFLFRGWRPRSWPGRSHPAPPTPPPEQTDFGE